MAKSIGVFDDALPLELKNKGVADFSSPKIRVHSSIYANVSPYIIKLDSERKIEARQEQTDALKIRELANQLAQSCCDDVVLIETPIENWTVSLHIDALKAQLRENEHVISPCKATSKLEIEREEYSIAQINVQSPDIFTVIAEEPTIEPYKDRYEDIAIDVKPSASWISHLHILLPKQARHRAMAAFLILSFIIVMPLHAMQSLSGATSQKIEIEYVGEQALQQIQSATDSMKSQDFETASIDFDRATESFQNAQESMDSMKLVVASLVNIIPQTNSTYETVQNLVSVGASLSNAASQMSKAASEISNSNSLSLTTKLGLLRTYITNVLPKIQNANKALKNIDSSYIPADYVDKINILKNTIPTLEVAMEEFLNYSQTLESILGNNQKMRYLLVFQNNTELRATGGFIGSFAQVDVLNGEIVNIDIPGGGSYDIQGQLTEFVAPPQPLTLINDRWEFHDANWLPDFPSSANKLISFYENAGGPTVDGVIAINATLMPKLLNITGPIDMKEYGREINSENFLFETQKIVEFEYAQYQGDSQNGQDAPKQFIGDLAPKILERLEESDSQTLLKVIDLMSSSLEQKDVLIFMQNNDLQADIEKLDWSGALKNTQGDYLMVVNSNLGGGKTDTVIKQDVSIDVEVQEDGSIINTVIITKEHKGMSSALFEGVNNVDYLRLYVPMGSELIQASGFEIPDNGLFKQSEVALSSDEDLLLWTSDFTKDSISQTDIWNEQGKTVFGNWMQTKPGETEVVTFTYKLPWKFNQFNDSLFQIAKSYIGLKNLNEYSILVQKQPGVETRSTTLRLTNAVNQKVLWTSQDDLFSTGATFNNDFDRMFATVLEQF